MPCLERPCLPRTSGRAEGHETYADLDRALNATDPAHRSANVDLMELLPPERLEDGPVVLRPLAERDVEPFVGALAAEPALGAWVGFDADPDAAAVRSSIEAGPKRAASGRGLERAIADRETDAFLGSVLLHSFEWEHRRCEVGFWLVRDARRRGIGTRAVGLVIDWVFSALDFERIEMTTTPDNPAVAPLARKLGFQLEGVLRARDIERGRRVDIVWFGLLRSEWNNRW